MNYFDKYNYNLFDMTGEQLTDLMIELVDHWWEDESRYVFHYFNPRHDSSEVFFSLKPKPKRKQPGNGLLVIGNEPCRWSDMRRFVEGSHFSSCWSNYLHQYFDRRTFFKAENKACVLLSFEIARRAYIESRFLYPVTRQMTISAIRTVMSLEAGYLIDMFTDNDYDEYYGRLKAFQAIMEWTHVNDLVSAYHNNPNSDHK